MAYHGVCVPRKIVAEDVKAYNRSAVSGESTQVDLDNGNVVVLSALSTTAGEKEVWKAMLPSTSAGLTGLWMVWSPEMVDTGSLARNIDQNPRNFFNAAGKVLDVFKPKVGDIISLSPEALTGTKSTNTFVNATDTTGGYKLVWGSTQTSSVLSLKLLSDTDYVPLPDGTIGTGRLTVYKFVVVGE